MYFIMMGFNALFFAPNIGEFGFSLGSLLAQAALTSVGVGHPDYVNSETAVENVRRIK